MLIHSARDKGVQQADSIAHCQVLLGGTEGTGAPSVDFFRGVLAPVLETHCG